MLRSVRLLLNDSKLNMNKYLENNYWNIRWTIYQLQQLTRLRVWTHDLILQVTSPYGNTLHHKEKIKTGQFAFTTTEPGNYLACFWIDSADKGVGASVNLDWKIGIAAKDWDSVARKEKIEVSAWITPAIQWK